MFFLRIPFLFLIRIYQKTISPDHGLISYFWPYGVCKYQPTCSEYGYLAIKKHGILKGALLAGWRILRCNPWSEGGMDNVPENFKVQNLNIRSMSNTKYQMQKN